MLRYVIKVHEFNHPINIALYLALHFEDPSKVILIPICIHNGLRTTSTHFICNLAKSNDIC